MSTSYLSCGNCGWYGPETDLITRTSYQTLEVWGAKVHKPDYDAVCPECHRDDSLNDANGPCQLCEDVPCISGTDTCAACAAKEAAEACLRCGGSGVVTLFGVDLGGGFIGDADEQPCPVCGEG